MGYIVKAKLAADRAAHAQVDTDSLAAEVTEVLLAARIAAEAERAAAKNAAVTLARKMAEKIIGHAVDLDPTVMAGIASQALVASRARGASVVLRVHPDDLAAVAEGGSRWQTGKDSPTTIQIVADAAVGRYGCVVETPVGRVDARLRTQLDALERVLGGSPGKAG